MPTILGLGFCESIDMIAAELGWALDAEKRTTHEMAVATRDLDTPVGVIEAGTVAAQRFTWEGLVDGRARRHGAGQLADGRGPPRSTLASRRPAFRGRDRRRAAGVGGRRTGCIPPVVGEHPEIGLTAPAMHCVNAVPYVCDAPAGIKTYLDLPLIAGRASTT